ncbi:FKBP-type peptidyl-prolyl cis-trans isomerase [Nonomuraea sp. NPDC050556]|uniref:FKBP-type peptidyl-prolyl cis-trans isomerase n=1 Tax=Nonomuraea sp. NPDC050556 TaxID=3364369 RepID=UPI0037A3A6F0
MRPLWLALAVLLSVQACGLSRNVATPSVSGAFGVKPVIKLPTGKPEAVPHVTVLSEGSGPPTRKGDVVITDVEIRQWQGNKPYMNTYDAAQPTTVVFDGQHVSETWEQALVGQRAGSRVMLVSPATKGFGPDGPPAGVNPADTLVLVFDVLGSYPRDARLIGQTLPSLPAGLGLKAQTLVDGSGEQVRPGARVVVQYVGARWPSRKIFDSSYARGGPNAFVLKDRAVPPGWVGGLTGRRVGSRVAIPVPAADTKGFTATTGGIGVPEGTLLYVVDIIDVI